VQTVHLFVHLVGAGEHGAVGMPSASAFAAFRLMTRLEMGGLFYRKVGRLSAL
jgi:hypothetical protein